jgi:hypothetical protein
MTDAENTGVPMEAAVPDAEDMGNAHVEAETSEVQEQPQETDADRNFRRLRESNEQLQKEREQDRQMMMALQQELLKRNADPQKASEPEVDEFAGIDKSDWSTIEQAEKLAAKIADSRFEKKWAEAEAKRRKEEMPNRIKSRFQDFDSVVTEDNVKQLQALEPDVAQALSLIGDEEAKAVAAYKYIKAFVPSAVETTASKQRIQENANQPKSLSSTGGTSPLSKAGAFEQGLTPALKKQLFAEMQSCARQS